MFTNRTPYGENTTYPRNSPRRGWRSGFLRWRPTIPHIRRPRSSALTIRVYAQETSFHYMGIVGRDAAPVNSPSRPGRGKARGTARGEACGWARGLLAACPRRDGAQPAGWPFVPARIAGSRSGTNLGTARRCVPRETCVKVPGAPGPPTGPGPPDKREQRGGAHRRPGRALPDPAGP